MNQANCRRLCTLAFLLLAFCTQTAHAAQGTGSVGAHAPRTASPRWARLGGSFTLLAGGAPVANVRVTLFTPDLARFHETRSLADGRYGFARVEPGAYRLGVAAPGLEYEESGIVLLAGANQRGALLVPETAIGSWEVIGNTLPEQLDATDIGVLRPDGTIFYCHDTTDPIIFDPVSGQKTFPSGSGSPQGCMNSTLLEDGSVLIVGGQAGSDPSDFVNGIPWVKRFWPNGTWTQLANLQHGPGRWYPGLARLADGGVLAIGGGMSPDATRTETCELFDLGLQTWSYTGSVGNPLEFCPSALLYTGDILQTWGGRPQLYDVQSGSWADTGQFVHPLRGFPGHSDHSLLILTDGRALAVGVSRLNQTTAVMTEYFDPLSGSWSVGTSPSLTRLQPEIVYLPDGQVFVGGGDKETTSGAEPNVLGIVRRCDLFDPGSASWRRVADMAEYREYHAVTLLLPDGRVTTTGGTRIKFQVGPTSADIEAYSPPYLSRGVRPQISDLSDASPARGANVSFDVFPATRLTTVVLMGLQSTTHWLDAGIPRRLELEVSQDASTAQVTFPTDPNLLPLGWYMLFGMVDDIPSEALILRIDP